ncbi:adenylate kinase isoenzyme 1-like isoform X2 [Atheta coriaria]|uniref:adenylate kinase isoenzyme 1-like isoform X2 n=1 Tax=Dalotia coriaria TaxID=877792 RepID=UPI0031F465C7
MGNNHGRRDPAECIPEMQRLSYDLSALQDIKVPYIWLVGAMGCGRNVQAESMQQNYGFEVIKISNLLRANATNDTDRGRVIKENLDLKNGYIPNTIILDLLKEEMLAKAKQTSGFIINGFPINREQADMFVKEIGPVDVIIVFKCSHSVMLERYAQKMPHLTKQEIKAKLRQYTSHVKSSLQKYDTKVEKFDTSKETADEIFPRIQSAMNVRIFGEAAKNILE